MLTKTLLASLFLTLAAASCPAGSRPACCSGLVTGANSKIQEALLNDGVSQAELDRLGVQIGHNCAETADATCASVHNPMVPRLQAVSWMAVCCRGTAVHDGVAIVDCEVAA